VDGHAERSRWRRPSRASTPAASGIEARSSRRRRGSRRAHAGVPSRRRPTSVSALGSVKTNIGHLDVAAGVAALIKAVLVLQHRIAPPTLHFTSPNPKLAREVAVLRQHLPLEWADGSTPRRAGELARRVRALTRTWCSRNRRPPKSEQAAAPSSRARRGRPPRSTGHRERAGLPRVILMPLADIVHAATLPPVCRRRRWSAAIARTHAPRERAGPAGVDRRSRVERHDGRILCLGGTRRLRGAGRPVAEQEPVFRAAIEECAARSSVICG
jgi:hypothetical protein